MDQVDLDRLKQAEQEEDAALQQVFQTLENPDIKQVAGYVASLLVNDIRTTSDILRLKGIVISLVNALIEKDILNEEEFDQQCQETIDRVTVQHLEEVDNLTAELEKPEE